MERRISGDRLENSIDLGLEVDSATCDSIGKNVWDLKKKQRERMSKDGCKKSVIQSLKRSKRRSKLDTKSQLLTDKISVVEYIRLLRVA